jgi:hypothetical protein
MSESPIEKCIEKWHAQLRGDLAGGLDELLAEDVVFYSPIVYTPQRGREVTKLYLTAAGATFSDEAPQSPGPKLPGRKFHYTRQVLSGRQAVLEFESEVDGKYVNGVDIIECDDQARIVEFRVMVRPLQAVNLLHQRMKAMLEQLGPPKD